MTMSWKTALLAGAGWALLSGGAALAQDTVPGTADDQVEPTASDQEAAVEEVVVTARRTEESLQRVPASVSAFSERTIERIGAQDPTGLQGAVPNLNIVQGRGSSNSTNIYIRGVGQPDALQTFDPAVGVYVDDVYIARIRGTQFDLLDLERVEVLRGPQGTLYGKNTPGGALKLVTRKPGREPRGQYSATFGSYDQREARLLASAPLSDTLAAGVALFGAKRDGYVTDPVLGRDYNDRDTRAARLSLAYTPTSTLRIDLSADYTKEDAALTVGQATSDLRGAFTPAPLPPLRDLPATPPEFNFRTRTNAELPNSTRLEQSGFSASVSYDLSDTLTLKSITAFRQLNTDDYIDFDATELSIAEALVAVDQNQTSQELQLNYDSGPLQIVSGVFYLKENVTSHQEAFANDFVRLIIAGADLGTPGATRFVDDDLETTNYSAFVNASYQLTPDLRVSGGLRYTSETKAYERATSLKYLNLLAVPAPFRPLFVNTAFAFADEESWEDVSPLLSADYQATENVLVYARAAKGFKSGGFNGRANTPGEEVPYEPETLESYEVGVKSGFLNNRVRLNLAAFYNDYENFQARVSRVNTTGAIPEADFAVVNAGKLKISGLELEMTAVPVAGLLLETQIGYLNAEYEEFLERRLIGGVLTPIDRSFQ